VIGAGVNGGCRARGELPGVGPALGGLEVFAGHYLADGSRRADRVRGHRGGRSADRAIREVPRVDAGDAYCEFVRGQLRGAVEIVGEVPRTGTPDSRLAEPERLYARKYDSADVMHHTGHHAWPRLLPEKITSWDFRKKVSFEDYDVG
jgi:hypothetical protein